jgi:hypothetical protein
MVVMLMVMLMVIIMMLVVLRVGENDSEDDVDGLMMTMRYCGGYEDEHDNNHIIPMIMLHLFYF